MDNSSTHISTLFGMMKVKRPTSERADLIQSLADSIRVPYMNVHRECWHLRGEAGNYILRIILDDVLRTGDNLDFRALKLREMIDNSKPLTKKK